MRNYTLYIQKARPGKSGDVTICTHDGKYRTFFWSDTRHLLSDAWSFLDRDERQAELTAWFESIKNVVYLDPIDKQAISQAVLP